MIYSKKYGRSFPSRSALMRYTWRDRQTLPILSWFGLRDAPYSDQWLQDHGFQSSYHPVSGWWIIAGVVVVGLLYLLFAAGREVGGRGGSGVG